jgi:hypothetical protein
MKIFRNPDENRTLPGWRVSLLFERRYIIKIIHPQENMSKSSKILSHFPFYNFFFGIYPVLFLWLNNYQKIHGYVVPRSLLISMVFSTIIFLFFLAVVRSAQKAGLLAGVWLILFYSYGHVYSLIDGMTFMGITIGRHEYLIAVWLILGLTGMIYFLVSQRNFDSITKNLNIFLAIVTSIALLNIGFIRISALASAKSVSFEQKPGSTSPSNSLQNRDVYYILLDGYDRPDLLSNDLNLDISPFLQELQSLGFVIPECGQSNYTDTASSMAATFNMDYLDALGFTYQSLASGDNETLLTDAIIKSRVRQIFDHMGYKFISFKSPYLFIDMPNSDMYLDVETAVNPGQKLESLRFQQLFIDTTFARTLSEWLEKYPEDSARLPVIIPWLVNPQSLNPDGSSFVGRNYLQYQQNLYQLATLGTIPDIPEKKFIYAHLLVTHQPFTFTPEGEFSAAEKDSFSRYEDQVTYLNSRLISIVNKILEKSAIPPIIILQGDHAFSDGGKRAKNFQAYYLPDNGGADLPPTFTNVNTFRLVLDKYFGFNYPMLPDKSFEIKKTAPGYVNSIPGSCMPEGFLRP